MANTQLQSFNTNKQINKQINYQVRLSKIFTAMLALILSLTLSLTPSSAFASALTSTSPTNTSFFNNTAAVATTAAVGALGLGTILVGLLSNNSSNNGSATAVLASITVTPHAPSIASGTTKQFHATGTYNDGTTQDLTKSVTWHSSHTSTAAISNNHGSHGLATAMDNDTSESVTTKIKATLFGITSHSVTLVVTAAPQTTFTVTYSGGSGSIGTAPVDSASPYASGAVVTVLGSSDAAGSNGLRSTGKVLVGWSASASATVDYVPGATFSITSNTILTAVWKTPVPGMSYGGGIIYKVATSPNVVSIVTLTDLAPTDWVTAQTECTNYISPTIGGVSYNDWYLPTLIELQSIYLFAAQTSGNNACNIINRGNFCTGGGLYSTYYWSSTEDAEHGGYAYAQVFDFGYTRSADKTNTNVSVRAVRVINY